MIYRCDRCHREWDAAAAAENDFTCTKKCGGSLIRIADGKTVKAAGSRQSASQACSGGNLAALPSILAIPLHEYDIETNPVQRLWHACDAVELTLRFVVTAGLADIARRGPLPEDLLRELRPRVEEPTLGMWRGMAEAVTSCLARGEAVLPELVPLVGAQLVPLIDGNVKPRTASASLSALRNQLAHGGGVTKAVASRLLEVWQPRIAAFANALAWTSGISLAVRTPEGKTGILRGPQPQPGPWQPPEVIAGAVAAAFSRGDEVLLIRGDNVLTLWPLTLFGPPRTADPEASICSEVVQQVYLRRGDVQLHFTPMGSEACAASEGDDRAHDAFRALFRLDEVLAKAREKRFEVQGFEGDLRKDAGKLIGRANELEIIRQKLVDCRDGGVLWLTGPFGIGKSYLVAGIASELIDEPREGTVVLAYRFKAGHDRCSRESFLRFTLERLRAAQPDAQAEDDGKRDTSPRALLKELKKRLEALASTKVLFILDGLDEIAERDAGFAAEVPLALALSGVTWLCAGRPERGLPEAFANASPVFPDGVPPMGAGDVRTMLLEKIGPLRKRLIAGDREQGDTVTNAFVTKVTACAQGLPLYVAHVIGDILNNRFRALDAGERLPPTLERYHEELLRRCEVGILHQVVTPLAATLAVAREPLSAATLCDLLVRGNVLPGNDGVLATVRRALAAMASMISRGTTPDGGEGYTLCHHSLRQHMEASAEMAPALATARANLGNLAKNPATGPAAPYLYRNGIAHLLEANRRDEALAVLTDFDYLMARLRMIADPDGLGGLLDDWRTVAKGVLNMKQRLWEAFFGERSHILRRGNCDWPSYKILFQLAVEHADDSPLTLAAEQWLVEGRCDWIWLRRNRRVAHTKVSGCLAVLEGHSGMVRCALGLPDGRILSWSYDDTLGIWDGKSGRCLAVLTGHLDNIRGAQSLPDGRILSWSRDRTLRLWDSKSGQCVAVLEGHSGDIVDARILPGGRILSRAKDKALRIWDCQSDRCVAVLEGHSDDVIGALMLPDGRILSLAKDKTLRIWDSQSGRCAAVLEGHSDDFTGAQMLPDGRILSWAKDKTLRIWDSQSGRCAAVLEGHLKGIDGTALLPDGRILSWSEDHTLRMWDSKSGRCVAVLEGHSGDVIEAMVLPDGRILSWSYDKTLRFWDNKSGHCMAVIEWHPSPRGSNDVQVLPDGRLLSWSPTDRVLCLWDTKAGGGFVVLEGHSDGIEGAQMLADGRILSWSYDTTLRLWDSKSGKCLAVLEGHHGGIRGASSLPDGQILSWSDDENLRLWDSNAAQCVAAIEGPSGKINGTLLLPNNQILSWSQNDKNIRLWDGRSGQCVGALEGHSSDIDGAQLLPDGRILSWSKDDTLRLWDSKSGPCVAVFKGHSSDINGAQLLPDGRILSWSYDTTLRLWDSEPGFRFWNNKSRRCVAVLKGHSDSITGALMLPDGRILSWSNDKTLRLWASQSCFSSWSSKSGRCVVVLEGHLKRILGAASLPDGRILSWSEDHSLRLWDSKSGQCVAVLEGHSNYIRGAQPLPDGRILSWSAWDGTARVWDANGRALATHTIENCLRLFPEFRVAYAGKHNVQSRYLWDGVWRTGRLRFFADDAVTNLSWHADADCTARHLLPDGRAILTQANGQVCFLNLYHGNRRITLSEAEKLLDRPSGVGVPPGA